MLLLIIALKAVKNTLHIIGSTVNMSPYHCFPECPWATGAQRGQKRPGGFYLLITYLLWPMWQQTLEENNEARIEMGVCSVSVSIMTSIRYAFINCIGLFFSFTSDCVICFFFLCLARLFIPSIFLSFPWWRAERQSSSEGDCPVNIYRHRERGRKRTLSIK